MDNEDVLGVVCLVDRTDGQAFEERHKNIAETITTSVQISLQNINLLKATDEKARMEKELETAKIVQEAFVPKGDPSFPGFTLTSFFQSANECGGDYWEYLNLPDKFILLIGDVTGHGTPSALITAVSASYQCTLKLMYKEFQNNLDLSPTKILERLNTVIYSSARGAFWMTFHAAVIDKKTLNMTYANAGHTFPFLFSKKEGEKVKCKSVTALGHPLGANEIWQGKTNEIQLAPGDTLIWYTDGLIECTNPDLKQIGKRYIRQFVPDKVDGPVKDICMGIIDEAFEFFDDEPPMDDITLLVGKISNDYKIEIELNTDKKSA